MALLGAAGQWLSRPWSWRQYSGPITISAWQRYTNGYPVIFGAGYQGAAYNKGEFYLQNSTQTMIAVDWWGNSQHVTLGAQAAPTGVWTGSAARSDSLSARAFFGSAGAAYDATVATDNGNVFNLITIGASPLSAPPNSTYIADIAECAIWAAALADAACLALALGQINPLDVEPGALIGYWPLRSDLLDYGPQHVAMQAMTATMPQFSVDQHPPVAGPRLRPRLRLGGQLTPPADMITVTGHAPVLDAVQNMAVAPGTIGVAGHSLGFNVGVITQRWQVVGGQWRMTGSEWLVRGPAPTVSAITPNHATMAIAGGQLQLSAAAPDPMNFAPSHATASITGGQPVLNAAVVTLTGVTLTPNTATTSSGGTVIGTLTAQGSGALGAVSYIMTNSAGGDFTLTGGNTVAFLPDNVPAGTYNVTIQVTAANASNSPQSYTVPITVTAAAAGVSAQVATPSQTWIQLGQPINFFTVTLSSITTAYAGLSVFNVAEGGRTAFSGSSLPTLTPAAVGTYTVRIYDAATAGNLIGESAPITVWAAANGPASAALTIGTLPTQTETEGTSFTISGTVVSANNYVLVSYTSPYTTGVHGYLSAPIVNGTWTMTMDSCTPYSSIYIDVIDPSTGLHVQSSKVTGQASTSAVLYFSPADNSPPGLSTATIANTTVGRFILADPGHLYPSPTWSGTGADASLVSNYDTYIATTATMVPGVHAITHTVTQAGQPTLSHEVDFYVPYSQPPTDITLTMQQTLTDQLPPYTKVATPFAYVGNGGLPNAVTYTATDPTGSFRISGINSDLITLKPLVAGTYNVTITATNGANPVYSKVFSLTAVSNIAVAASNMTLTPAAMTNMMAPGAVVGTPVVTGLSGSVTWGIVTDAGDRLVIDRTSGQLTTAKYLSAVVGAETCTVFATDGTRTCVADLTIPVTGPGTGPTLTVGAGQTYATIQAAIQAAYADPMGAYANATIEIHPGTYTDDLDLTTAAQYLSGHLSFVGVLDANNNRPLITFSTFPSHIYNGKGAFLTDGFDLTLSNLEVSRVRLDGGVSNQFMGVIRIGDSMDITKHITAVKVSNCVFHDCDMGVMGGLAGARVYLYNTEISFCGDGTGYSHNLYVSSDPYSYPGIYVDGALLHVENCLSIACSRGHLLKSRMAKTVVINSSFINTNDGFCSSCMDIPDGGDLTVSGCTFYSGPNDDRGTCINYGAEYLGGHVARGNTVSIDNCSFNTTIENIDGYMSVQGVVNPFAGSLFTHPPAWAGMPSVTISNSSFAGFPAQLGGANDNAAICGTITVGANVTFAAASSPYSIVHPGSTPWNGYMDTVVGPCPNPYSRYSYTQGWNPQTVVPTVWSAYTVSHTAAVGTVVATPLTAASPVAISQPAGPFTYTVLTPTYVAPAPPPSPFAVASDGTITVASALTQGQVVTMLIDAACATQAHSPQFFSIWVT